MTTVDYALVLVCVCLLSIAQILQKEIAMQFKTELTWLQQSITLLSSARMLVALGCMGISALLWFVILYRNEVSQVFPWLNLSMVIVVISAHLRFREHLSLTRCSGVVLVILGVALVSGS